MTIQTNLIDHTFQIIRVADGEVLGHFKSKRIADETHEQLAQDGTVVHDTRNPKPPTDPELRRMIRMDMGDSYNLHFPDGTQRGLGFCAEGPLDHSVAMLAQARRLYTEWAAGK